MLIRTLFASLALVSAVLTAPVLRRDDTDTAITPSSQTVPFGVEGLDGLPGQSQTVGDGNTGTGNDNNGAGIKDPFHGKTQLTPSESGNGNASADGSGNTTDVLPVENNEVANNNTLTPETDTADSNNVLDNLVTLGVSSIALPGA